VDQSFLVTALSVIQPGAQPSGLIAPSTFGNSALFDGISGTHLRSADPASLRIAHTDILLIGGWIKPGALADGVILSKKGTFAGDNTYAILVTAGGGLNFGCLVNGSLSDAVANSVSANTKYFFLAYKDVAATTLHLAVNTSDATANYSGDEGSFSSGAGIFSIGDDTLGDGNFAGNADELFICKNPADLAAAISLINSTIYNSGHGVRYSALSTQDKTDIGLVSWWGLDEASGNRLDLHGSVTLTASGGVTQASPLLT
jgi:hypothetical protein